MISSDFFVISFDGTNVFVLEDGRVQRRVVVNVQNRLMPWLGPVLSHLMDPERPELVSRLWTREVVVVEAGARVH